MGGEPYYYHVKYRPSVGDALQDLRRREFLAGRYYPAQTLPKFPLEPSSPAPGALHRSIDEAREAAGADGTSSILDIECITDVPQDGAAAPFPHDLLLDLFRTLQPTKEALDAKLFELLNDIERGQCLYLGVARNGTPDGNSLLATLTTSDIVEQIRCTRTAAARFDFGWFSSSGAGFAAGARSQRRSVSSDVSRK